MSIIVTYSVEKGVLSTEDSGLNGAAVAGVGHRRS